MKAKISQQTPTVYATGFQLIAELSTASFPDVQLSDVDLVDVAQAIARAL